jgi:chromosome segregation ATPase
MTDYKALYEQAQEENEKLKKKLEHKEDKIEDHLASRNFYEEQCQELKSECEQLRKYNEKLKQFSMEVHNFAFSTEYDDLDIVSSFDFDSIIKELKKDEDNFNGIIEDLQKEINHKNQKFIEWIEENKELKQEIKELDSYAKKHEQDNRILRFSTIGMTEEIDKLKEKNNKWTYWASDVIYWCNTHNKDILQSKKLIDGENKPTIDNVRDFGKEITELKEENSILRDINQKRIPALIRRWNEEDAEENEKLKEEIKEFKEKMDTICIELYAFWNCEDPDPHAVNIGDICGYDEDKHKKLYEKKYPGTVWFSDDEE